MTDVNIEISGEMEPPVAENRNQIASFLKFQQLPDPKEWIQNKRQNVRPWLEFVQTANFKPPPSIPRLSRRILRNIEYFQSNYLFVFLGLVIYCLVTSPFLLFALAGSFYVGYKLSQRHLTQKTVIFGHELTLAHQYGLVSLFSMPVLYIVGAGAVLFWVIGASFVVITLHAAFYNIDAVLNEEDYLLQEV